MKYDVFISYSSKDRKACLELAQKLQDDEIIVWVDHWRIEPGDNIHSSITRALDESRRLLFLISPDSLASEWTEFESTILRFRDPSNSNRQFIPVLMEDCHIPGTIAAIRYIDYRDRSEEAYNEIRKACSPAVRVSRKSEHTTLIPDELSDSVRGWETGKSVWDDRLMFDERKSLLVDLSECEFIDSNGMGFLLSLHKRSMSAGGKLALYNLSEKARNVIKVLKMEYVFNIFATREEAVRFLEEDE